MTQPYDPNQPPPYGAPAQPYGAPPPAPPPAYGGPDYGDYGPPPGQRVNDPAPMGMRLLARIIDGILTGTISLALSYALGMHVFETTNSNGTHEVSFQAYNGDYFELALIGLIITACYEIGMLVSRGATLGKMAVGVRVAMLENGQNPTLSAAFTRWVIPAVAGTVLPLFEMIIFLSPFFDPTHRNRGWYDLAAKTIAVRTK
jgi:uncharacterized RDD family membrane protein YckC